MAVATAVVSGERLPFDEESIPSDISEESDDDTSNDCIPSTELSMRITSIADILNNLYRLSYKIRNSGLRPSSTRASLIQAVDNETGINLFDTLFEFDSRHLIELFTALREGKSEDFRSSDVLLERLATSNVLRRKQFRYWERHARKLGVQVLLVHHILIREKPSVSEASGDVGDLQVQRLELPPTPQEQSQLSGTNATPYDPALDDRTEKETILSLASTALDADGKGIEVPKPPEEALNGDTFTCPYCWVVCPPKEGRGKTWKSHVLHDLKPYVCTYEACNSANDLYQSRKAWVDHEDAMHRPIWRCRDHPDALHATSAGFQRHLLVEHDKGLSGEQLEDLTRVSKLGRVDDRDACPICFEEQPFPKGLTNHLANHLERIALFSLPRTISAEDKNTDESQFSKLFNIGSEDFSTSGQFEEEGEDLTDTQSYSTEYPPDPSPLALTTSDLEEMNTILDELYTMLDYYERFFAALKSNTVRINPNQDGDAKRALDLASAEAERCLLMTQRLLECDLRVQVYAKYGDALTEILRDTWRFLYRNKIELDKLDEASSKDQGKHITVDTEALGGLGIVNELLEAILQVFEGSISFTTGLIKIEEYQSILTTLWLVEETSDMREDQHMTESIEQPPDVTHETTEAPEYLRYRVAQWHMFKPGEVFKTLWPEPGSGIPYAGERTLHHDRYGENIYVSFRRFIVVANDLDHCTCVPITTYGGRGLKKDGDDPQSHGIVCELGNPSPQLLQGEPEPGFPLIRVRMHEPGERIDVMTRVCYAKLMTVDHDFKVLFIGRVAAADLNTISCAVDACWEKKDHKMRRGRRR